MSKKSVTWVGLDTIQLNLRQMETVFDQRASRRILAEGAEVIEADMKSTVRRRTGKGQRSIMHEFRGWQPGRAEMAVGWHRDAFYLFFLEMGTKYMSPKPFLRPAFDARAKDAIRAIHNASRILIRKAA